MNKFIGIGQVKEMKSTGEEKIILIETVDEALTGGRPVITTPPPILVSGCEMPQDLKVGEFIMITGHYEHKKEGDQWRDFIRAYCVSRNLSMNLFFGSGNLGADAKMTPQGKAATFNVACKRYFKGEQESDWVRTLVFNATQNALKLLSRGRQVFVVGALHSEKYPLKEGGDRSSTSLKVRDWQAA